MHTGSDLHVYYKLANAPVLPFPFPHLVVDEIFPAAFYPMLREHLPAKEKMKSPRDLKRVGKDYSAERFVLPLTDQALAELPPAQREFWTAIASWMLSGPFASMMLNKFAGTVSARFGGLEKQRFQREAMLVQDYTTYALGPHTDRKDKVVSALFYLPADATHAHLGTSLYSPKDLDFRCRGGPHYSFEAFHKVYTMPYRPNTLFAFPKSDHSFHGVEPIQDAGVRRDLLLYDITVRNPA
jgi:hypothetical protein